MGKYWILKTTTLCPICGSEETYRERMTTEKPEDINERYKLEEVYDYCDAL